MARTLKFEQVTDSRIDENIKDLLEQRIQKLEALFAPIEGVAFEHTAMRFIDWNNADEGGCQYRVTCYVTKNTRKVTWNDIYNIVNSVKSALYVFI